MKTIIIITGMVSRRLSTFRNPGRNSGDNTEKTAYLCQAGGKEKWRERAESLQGNIAGHGMSAPILRVKTLSRSLRAAWSAISSLLPEPVTEKGQNSGDSPSWGVADPTGVFEIRKGPTGRREFGQIVPE